MEDLDVAPPTFAAADVARTVYRLAAFLSVLAPPWRPARIVPPGFVAIADAWSAAMKHASAWGLGVSFGAVPGHRMIGDRIGAAASSGIVRTAGMEKHSGRLVWLPAATWRTSSLYGRKLLPAERAAVRGCLLPDPRRNGVHVVPMISICDLARLLGATNLPPAPPSGTIAGIEDCDGGISVAHAVVRKPNFLIEVQGGAGVAAAAEPRHPAEHDRQALAEADPACGDPAAGDCDVAGEARHGTLRADAERSYADEPAASAGTSNVDPIASGVYRLQEPAGGDRTGRPDDEKHDRPATRTRRKTGRRTSRHLVFEEARRWSDARRLGKPGYDFDSVADLGRRLHEWYKDAHPREPNLLPESITAALNAMEPDLLNALCPPHPAALIPNGRPRASGQRRLA